MFANVNGVRTFYELSGPSSGRVLALCHSLGTSSALWDRQLARQTVRLRGCGFSDTTFADTASRR
jgi:pimeloyl-ACP methyl ester carboxylesterase